MLGVSAKISEKLEQFTCDMLDLVTMGTVYLKVLIRILVNLANFLLLSKTNS